MRFRRLIVAPVVVLGVLAFAGVPAQAATVRSKIGSFGPNGRGKGGFDGTPESVAVEQSTGDVYVLSVNETEEASIYKFNATGEPVDFSSIGKNVIALSPGKQSGRVPHGQIVVDNSSSSLDKGDIYVASKALEGVLIYSGSTGIELGLLTNKQAEAGGVTVDSSGNLYVSNPEENIGIKKYEPLSSPINESDFTGEELKVAAEAVGDIAVDSAGDIYAAGFEENSGVIQYKASQFGEEGPTGASVDANIKATTLAVDPSSQDLYIDEQSDIAVYAPGGTREEEFGSGSLSTSYGVAVSDASGNIGDVYVSAGGEGSEMIIFGPPHAPSGDTLTVTKTGTGKGTVECEVGSGGFGACAPEYAEGDEITIKGAAELSSKFAGWSAGTGSAELCTGTSECTFMLKQASTVIAEFNEIPLAEFPVTITSITGEGEVKGTTIACTADGIGTASCTEEVKEGASVTLTATPKAGYAFKEWTGKECAGSTSSTCKFTMPSEVVEEQVVFAVSTKSPLTVFVTGEGTVTSNPSGITNCGPLGGVECTDEFEGTVTLTGKAVTGYILAGWIGCRKTTATECTVDVTAPREVTAVFLKEGEKGTTGSTGTNGAPGVTGAQGEKGSPGSNGADGKNGLQGASGAQGPAGPLGAQGPAGAEGLAGPAGQVELVTCKTVKKSKKSVQQCTTKLVSSTVKFTLAGASARATLSRHGAVYAAGTARIRRGRTSLRLMPLRSLRPGYYTLTLIAGAGQHETIRREAFKLR
jgi:hypothetical protein